MPIELARIDLAPQTTLKPVRDFAPQTTLVLPQTTEVPEIVLGPQTTDVPQTTEVAPQTTLVPPKAAVEYRVMSHSVVARVIDCGRRKRYSGREVRVVKSRVYVQITRSVGEDVVLVGVNVAEAICRLRVLTEALPSRLHQPCFHLIGSQR